MLQALAAAGKLEHDQMAHDVGLDVDIRVNLRMAHAGLGRQMDDPVEAGIAPG